MMKRMIAVAATLILTATAAFAAAENYTVGIGQFAEHGSLDNCRTGFVEGLAEAGLVEGDNLTILYQNAQADMGIAQQIAAQFAAKPVDLMVGIATPMAQACYNAAGEIPTIYTAVSDPVSAGFADADGKAAGEVTGTSDALPVAAQLLPFARCCRKQRQSVFFTRPARSIPFRPSKPTSLLRRNMALKSSNPVSAHPPIFLWRSTLC